MFIWLRTQHFKAGSVLKLGLACNYAEGLTIHLKNHVMKKFNRVLFAALLGCSTLMVACDKEEEKEDNIVFKTGQPLSGAQEVPARSTGATGTFDVSYNKDSKVMSYRVNWTDLSTVPTGAHIHGTAPRGVNAGIRHDFFSAIPKTASGTYSGTVTVDNVAIKEDSLLNGFYYFNFHTTTFPGGEIRGQIEF